MITIVNKAIVQFQLAKRNIKIISNESITKILPIKDKKFYSKIYFEPTYHYFCLKKC